MKPTFARLVQYLPPIVCRAFPTSVLGGVAATVQQSACRFHETIRRQSHLRTTGGSSSNTILLDQRSRIGIVRPSQRHLHNTMSDHQEDEYCTTTSTTIEVEADSKKTATTTSKVTTTYPLEMSETERYLFDLNGYLVIRNVLTKEEVLAANMAIDRHLEKAVERLDPTLRNAVPNSPLYGLGPGRKDLGRVMEWGPVDSKVFKSILAHPRLLPLYHGILGPGYHLDHLPFVLMQDHGAEGFQLHGGTIDCCTGEYNPHLAYTCHHQTIRCSLLGVNVMLTDHNPGDGGFCVVPGSHKSNFKMPPGFVNGQCHDDDDDDDCGNIDEDMKELIRQPTTKAGDVVLFSEGTVHGALPWTPIDRPRRACLYRFAPATNVYGRSYFGPQHGDMNNPSKEDQMGWPRAIYDDLTDAQRAVLEPPYANRLDRPIIQPDGTVIISSRSEQKKLHDRQVFGTKYF